MSASIEPRPVAPPADEGSTRSAWVAGVLERFEAPLLAYAARFLRDEHRARDVVQDVFVRLCSQARSAVEPTLAPWLYRVCRNRAIDELRKGRPMTPTDSTTLDARPAPATSSSLDARDDATHALAEVSALPPLVQEAIRLKFAHGLSYREIGEVMGMTPGHVGVRIHEGMTVLRRRLQRATGPVSLDGGAR